MEPRAMGPALKLPDWRQTQRALAPELPDAELMATGACPRIGGRGADGNGRLPWSCWMCN